MEEIMIRTDFIKLDALMKFASLVSSGGEAKDAIAQNMVKVNGEVCTMRGKKCRSGDLIEFNGQKIKVSHED